MRRAARVEVSKIAPAARSRRRGALKNLPGGDGYLSAVKKGSAIILNESVRTPDVQAAPM